MGINPRRLKRSERMRRIASGRLGDPSCAAAHVSRGVRSAGNNLTDDENESREALLAEALAIAEMATGSAV